MLPPSNFLSRVHLTHKQNLSALLCKLAEKSPAVVLCTLLTEGTLQLCLWIFQLIILPQTTETDLDDCSINSSEGVIRENTCLHSPPQCRHINVNMYFWMWGLITKIILRNEIRDHPRITPSNVLRHYILNLCNELTLQSGLNFSIFSIHPALLASDPVAPISFCNNVN